MDALTQDTIATLIRARETPQVSIYFPTHRAGRDTRENAIFCKNAVREAEQGLQQIDAAPADREAILDPLRSLVTDGTFWQHQSDGLAIFATPSLFQTFRLPAPFAPLVHVGRRFHLKPLTPLLEGDGAFYLLALSQKRVRLFRGSKFNIEELTPHNLPLSLQDALNIDEYLSALQFHSYRPSRHPNAAATANFHGHGGSGGEVQKRDELREFLLRVATGVRELLAPQPAPLVFAGVDYLLPLLRDALHEPYLLEEAVRGNPDQLSAEELHAAAWKIVSVKFAAARDQKLAEYGRKSNSGLTSCETNEVVDAACQGAVDTLFVAEQAHAWGEVVADAGKIVQHEERRDGDHDLLDIAATETLACGGIVYTLSRDAMPDRALAAAIYRRPVERVLSLER